MSLLRENVVPGNHGKIFETDAKKEEDLLKIKDVLLQMEGINEVIINMDIFPREVTIHTIDLIKVRDVQSKVISLGFHMIPKGLLGL